mgnify:CR=1 FL=1|jgi:hypothetical protein
MLASNDELKDLYKCFFCDCKTLSCGICTWQGEPCKECFDKDIFQHRAYDPNNPGKYLRNNSSSSPREVMYPKMSEIQTNGNGDCLYESISKALVLNYGYHNTMVSIDMLRNYVSRLQNMANFEAYKVTYGGDGCMKDIRTLRAFKNLVQYNGEQVGPDKCLWGDENVLNIISNGYLIRFVVFDHSGEMIQTIKPDNSQAARTILLRLNRQLRNCEHFNLLTFNKQTLLQEQEWNALKQILKI